MQCCGSRYIKLHVSLMEVSVRIHTSCNCFRVVKTYVGRDIADADSAAKRRASNRRNVCADY